MNEMGIRFESLGPTLEQHRAWRLGETFQEDHHAEIESALRQTASITGFGGRLRGIARSCRGDHSPARSEVTLSVTKARTPGESPTPSVDRPSTPVPVATPLLFPTTLHPSLAFTRRVPSGETVVTFPLSALALPPKPCLKRRRLDTDVDGPGTFSISCKKRRLLRHLITSRLSQAYSLPATHILNREAVTSGSKRIVKLTAIMSARRLNNTVTTAPQAQPSQQPSPSTWLRRAAVLNSLRSRVHAVAAERANGGPIPDVAAAQAYVFQQRHGSPTALIGGRYPITSPSQSGSGSGNKDTASLPPTPAQRPPSAGPHPPHSGTGHHGHVQCTRVRIPSPQLRPLRSPELRVSRPLIPLEDIEPLYNEDWSGDDSMAFPTSELESRYLYDDDDSGDEGEGAVYADFSVIFGGGGSESDDEGKEKSAGSDGGGEDDCFEDYMDDLDGIPWGEPA
ncbi:uncharacterized protein C8A04DRAFT_15649 [Dichotomopilus funicola]|uniref:Transcription factor Iwr1 domain-containing protein n=1 Tax=Dichotomopilus funicola TaxID=1934379 RepID=A0AAN6ZJ26_9PEZI|nr:hypothetical protein C8A04DRAFT_15649 [Dichotomopilus funicola]